MDASPPAENGGPAQPQDNWNHADDHTMASRGDADPANGLPPSAENPRGPGNNPDYPRGSSVDGSVSGSKADTAYRDKQVKVLRSLPVSCSSRKQRMFVWRSRDWLLQPLAVSSLVPLLCTTWEALRYSGSLMAL
jgi:hypothetical protein